MNLKTSLNKLEGQELNIKNHIKSAIVLSYERTGFILNDIDNTVNDIYNEFKFLNVSQIFEAIKYGSLGKYGKTYKLTTQEIFLWIREYLKENNNKLI